MECEFYNRTDAQIVIVIRNLSKVEPPVLLRPSRELHRGRFESSVRPLGTAALLFRGSAMSYVFYSAMGDFLGAETGEDLPKLAIGQVITRQFECRIERRWEVILTVPEREGSLIVLLTPA